MQEYLLNLAIESVRSFKNPLSDLGWKNLISRELDIDLETSTRIFEKLIEMKVLIFVRLRGKRSIYMNDRTPEFKRYTWSGDLHYG